MTKEEILKLAEKNQPIERTLLIFGTGHKIPDVDLKYIGTYQIESGIFVFHLYEL